MARTLAAEAQGPGVGPDGETATPHRSKSKVAPRGPGRTLSPMPSEQKGAYDGHLASRFQSPAIGIKSGGSSPAEEEEAEMTHHDMVKGDLIVELTEKATTTTVREFTPAGTRMEVNLQGWVNGRYKASHVETVSFLFKPDGTAEGDVRAIEYTEDGEPIFVTARLWGKQGTPTTFENEADVTFRTSSQKLSWLNSTKGHAKGTFDLATGEFKGKIVLMK